jgi:putative aldouronate transport system substrate-binding protein
MFAPAFGIRRTYYLRPGTQDVAFGPLEPEYRTYLEELNKWYKEGLFTDNSITSDGALTDANIIADLAGSWKALTNNWEKYLDNLRQTNPSADFIPVSWPAGRDGNRYTDRTELNNHVDKEKTIVTTACANPVAAAKLLDYMYSEEGGMLLGWGLEGLSYEMVNGSPVFIEFEPGAVPGRSYYVKPHVTYPKYGYTEPWSKTFNPLRIVAAEKWAGNVSTDLIYPPYILFSQDETNTITDINADVGSYITDMTNKFITGEEPLSNFDTFVSNVEKYGISEIIDIYQLNLALFNEK